MTENEFDKLWMDSVIAMHAWASNAPDSKYRADCEHHIQSMLINRTYLKGRLLADDKHITCKICGKIEVPSWDEPMNKQVVERKLCFSHNHWRNLAEEFRTKANPKLLIHNGNVYSDGGNQPGGKYLGFGGQVWTIAKDGKQWVTNNLWSGGSIIYDMAYLLPDNCIIQPGNKL